MLRRFVFPGSFDPPTIGHLDLIRRARLACDELVVAVLDNPEKRTLFTAEERLRMLEDATAGMGGLRCLCWSGLLVDLLEELGADILVRGVRDSGDFLYESRMAETNRFLRDGSETLFLMARPELSFVSASAVRQLLYFGRDIRRLVPEPCRAAIEKKSRTCAENKQDHPGEGEPS